MKHPIRTYEQERHRIYIRHRCISVARTTVWLPTVPFSTLFFAAELCTEIKRKTNKEPLLHFKKSLCIQLDFEVGISPLLASSNSLSIVPGKTIPPLPLHIPKYPTPMVSEEQI